jgi:hypothetical protein
MDSEILFNEMHAGCRLRASAAVDGRPDFTLAPDMALMAGSELYAYSFRTDLREWGINHIVCAGQYPLPQGQVRRSPQMIPRLRTPLTWGIACPPESSSSARYHDAQDCGPVGSSYCPASNSPFRSLFTPSLLIILRPEIVYIAL